MAETNLNPFLPTAAKPVALWAGFTKNRILQVTRLLRRRCYLKRWMQTGSSAKGGVKWRDVDNCAVGISETH